MRSVSFLPAGEMVGIMAVPFSLAKMAACPHYPRRSDKFYLRNFIVG